jgi:uncharacterized protein (DUF697 family)
MPSFKPAGNALGAVGSIKNFMNVVKEVDFEEIRARAEQVPGIIVVSENEEDARSAAIRLFGDRPERFVEVKGVTDPVRLDGARYDLIVVYDPGQSRLLERIKKAVGGDHSTQVAFLAAHLPDGKNPEEQLRAEIVAAKPELAPGLGRFFPSFRQVAARAVMDETAKANAQFALVSNVPTVIPVLGNLIAAGADLIVLTKNQIMMCYKIAALNGRDLHDQSAIIAELAPVVGAGFLWRTAAREAAAFLPLAAGTVPKVAIAYAGTMAIGWSADFYYRMGKKPTRTQVNEFLKRANDIAKALPAFAKEHAPRRPEATIDSPTESLPPRT